MQRAITEKRHRTAARKKRRKAATCVHTQASHARQHKTHLGRHSSSPSSSSSSSLPASLAASSSSALSWCSASPASACLRISSTIPSEAVWATAPASASPRPHRNRRRCRTARSTLKKMLQVGGAARGAVLTTHFTSYVSFPLSSSWRLSNRERRIGRGCRRLKAGRVLCWWLRGDETRHEVAFQSVRRPTHAQNKVLPAATSRTMKEGLTARLSRF